MIIQRQVRPSRAALLPLFHARIMLQHLAHHRLRCRAIGVRRRCGDISFALQPFLQVRVAASHMPAQSMPALRFVHAQIMGPCRLRGLRRIRRVAFFPPSSAFRLRFTPPRLVPVRLISPRFVLPRFFMMRLSRSRVFRWRRRRRTAPRQQEQKKYREDRRQPRTIQIFHSSHWPSHTAAFWHHRRSGIMLALCARHKLPPSFRVCPWPA